MSMTSDLIAEQTLDAVAFDGGKRKLNIRIFRPLGTADGTYECEYDITNLLGAKLRRCCGPDSLTALAKAIRNVSAELVWLSGHVTVEKLPSDPVLAVDPALTAMMKAWLANRCAEAFDLSLPLAEKEWFPAQSVAGTCYYYGSGLVPNLQTNIDLAIHWLLKAAEAGEPSACDKLALIYSTPGLDSFDSGKATYYRKLAKEYGWIY